MLRSSQSGTVRGVGLPALPSHVSLRARAFGRATFAARGLISVAGRGAVWSPPLLAAARPGVNYGLGLISPVPRGVHAEAVRVDTPTGQVRGEWLRHGPRVTEPESGRSIVYYLHGSGYVICSPRTHRGLVARLTRRAGIDAFSLDYRLGPRHRWPSAGDDAIRGYRWLLSQGFTGEQIIVAGDSAGGHLALDLLAANHRDGTEQPRAMVLFSPLYDPSFALAHGLAARGVRDPIIDVAGAQRFLRLYTGDADPDDPRMRVLLSCDMALPDTLVQVGAREIMIDDARAIDRRIRDAGGTCELQEWPGQGHVFQMFPYFTPESKMAVAAAAGFIQGHGRRADSGRRPA